MVIQMSVREKTWGNNCETPGGVREKRFAWRERDTSSEALAQFLGEEAKPEGPWGSPSPVLERGQGQRSAVVDMCGEAGHLRLALGAFLLRSTWPPCGSFCCHSAGNTGRGKGSTWLRHYHCNIPFPPASQEMPGTRNMSRLKAGAKAVGGSTHMRTGLMAFLMLPKAARPSSSRRHLSASSAGLSFSFSGAWRGEGDRLGRQRHTGRGWHAGCGQALCSPAFLFFIHAGHTGI